MKKFYLKSMGCKSNQFEGQIVSQNLIEAGYQEVKKLEDAENQKSLPIRNNTFSVEIPRHDFRILVAE